MADDKKPDYSDKDYRAWLEAHNLKFDEMSDSDKEAKWKEFSKGRGDEAKESANNPDKPAEEKEKPAAEAENQTKENEDAEKGKNLSISQQKPEEAKENINVSQDQNQENDWIKDKRNSWQPWCEQEHTPAYIYDENQEFKTGLKFDVYKNEEDKAAGKKAATIQYNSPKDVVIEDTPDYEFFAKLGKEAKKDKIPGVTFDGEMTDEFKARLAASCLENGLNMENGPDHIDVNLLGNVNDDVKKKVEEFNKKQENKKFYEQAKQDAAALAQKNEGKTLKDEGYSSFTIEEQDPAKAAMLYAAYSNAGVWVKNASDVTKENKGRFQTDQLDFMSDEEKKPLTKFNEKQDQIDAVRQKVHAALSEKVMSGDQDALAIMEEREDVNKARANIRAGKGTEQDKAVIAARQARLRQQNTR